MRALHLVTDWPVEHVAAAVVTPDAPAATIGDVDREFRLASLAKPMAAWAIMVGVEEGVVELDAPLRDLPGEAVPSEGATLRHLLSHASGFGFDGPEPVAAVERRRMYSNTGVERAAAELAAASGMSFATYQREAVFGPLGMTATELRGSPAHAVWSTLADTIRFVGEMLSPRLLAAETHAEVVRPQYPALAGIVPDVGRFDPCPWGLGVEVRGDKSPHWTGRANSPSTFGHFGGAGTMMWVDPLPGVGVVALTDRSFDEWRDDALSHWPSFSDAALAEVRSSG